MSRTRLIVATLVVLLLLLVLEALLLMLVTGNIFNTFALPIFNNLDFLWLLIKNNPGAGLLELISQPLLILGHSPAGVDDYSAALYYYPISSLLHLGLAWLIAARLLKTPAQLARPLFIGGALLLLLSINYVWLAGCCGAVPGWTLDTAFLYYVFESAGNPVARVQIYEDAYTWMQTGQLVVMALAGLLLWHSARHKPN